MAVDLPPFPPFGFSVWYDRHRGRGWCWQERHPSELQEDRTEGEGFESRRAAIQDVRGELAARRERLQRSVRTD